MANVFDKLVVTAHVLIMDRELEAVRCVFRTALLHMHVLHPGVLGHLWLALAPLALWRAVPLRQVAEVLRISHAQC